MRKKLPLNDRCNMAWRRKYHNYTLSPGPDWSHPKVGCKNDNELERFRYPPSNPCKRPTKIVCDPRLSPGNPKNTPKIYLKFPKMLKCFGFLI